MAGHSKWANIKHKKKVNDQKRSKKISKIVKNIQNSFNKQLYAENSCNIKNAINVAKENNINKKIINKLLLIRNKDKEYIPLAFKNNEITLIINVTDTQDVISHIKYTLSTLFFKPITISDVSKNIYTYKKVQLKKNYNEMHVLNCISELNVKNILDDNIIIDAINITDDFKNKIKISNVENMIVFKNKINIDEKTKHKLSSILANLIQNTNVKDIFHNVYTLAFN